MGIEIIGKLTQKNNGDFKLVDLADVDYDGTGKSAKQELEKKIEEAKNSSTPYDDTEIKTDIDNIKTDLGTEELTTTAKNVKGAVNEVAAQYKDIAKKTITTEERTKLTNLENYDDSSIKNDIQAQKTRIDNLATLKSGSTTGDAELIDARIGYDNNIYDNLGSAIREQFKNMENELNDIPIKTVVNLADNSKINDNVYYSHTVSAGGFPTQANANGYFTLPKITLKRGKKYYITHFEPNFTYTFEKGTETRIEKFSEKSYTAPLVYTPEKDVDLYLTFTGNTNKSKIMVIENCETVPKTFYKYNEKIVEIPNYKYEYDKYGNKINTIYVKKDGTGNYTTIYDAIKNITDSSKMNQYNIYVSEGTYNIIEEMGGADYLKSIVSMDGAYGGLLLPNYVHLIGLGNTSEDVVLTANIEEFTGLDFNILDNAVAKVSTVNVFENNNLENLTIQGGNVRYALHDESSNKYENYVRNMRNVRVLHKGNLSKYTWTSTDGAGCGSGSGATYNYENCVFEAALPYSIHDNIKFTKQNKFIFNNCQFIPKLANKIACRFVTVSTEDETITHDVEMNNCLLCGSLGQYEEAGGKGRKFHIHGGGNSIMPYIYTNTSKTATEKPITFNEETAYMLNGDTTIIKKGAPVRVYGSKIYPLANYDSTLFYGIALEDIRPGENGHIKTKGYVYINDINNENLTAFNVGQKIGIVNGQISVVTDNNYIGVATDWNIMLLK